MLHVDVSAAACMMNITTAAVYKSIHKGRIGYLHDGRHYWVPVHEVTKAAGKTEQEILAQLRSKGLSALDINTDFRAHKPEA
jgi:excisionase family DNA binding protein